EAEFAEGIGWAEDDLSALDGQDAADLWNLGLVAHRYPHFGWPKLPHFKVIAFRSFPLSFGRENMGLLVGNILSLWGEDMGDVEVPIVVPLWVRPGNDELTTDAGCLAKELFI